MATDSALGIMVLSINCGGTMKLNITNYTIRNCENVLSSIGSHKRSIIRLRQKACSRITLRPVLTCW